MAEGGSSDADVRNMVRHIAELARARKEAGAAPAPGVSEAVSTSKDKKMDDADGMLPVASEIT